MTFGTPSTGVRDIDNDETQMDSLATRTPFEVPHLHRGCVEATLSGPHGGGTDTSRLIEIIEARDRPHSTSANRSPLFEAFGVIGTKPTSPEKLS